MNSLTTGPLADVLDGLLAAAAAQRGQSRRQPRPGVPPPQSLDASDFRAEFAGAEHRYMAVSPETGRLLYLLARTGGARNVVEFGTSFGVSTLFLAAAVRDNGGGRLIGTEFESTKSMRPVRRSLEQGSTTSSRSAWEMPARHLQAISRPRSTSSCSTEPNPSTWKSSHS